MRSSRDHEPLVVSFAPTEALERRQKAVRRFYRFRVAHLQIGRDVDKPDIAILNSFSVDTDVHGHSKFGKTGTTVISVRCEPLPIPRRYQESDAVVPGRGRQKDSLDRLLLVLDRPPSTVLSSQRLGLICIHPFIVNIEYSSPGGEAIPSLYLRLSASP